MLQITKKDVETVAGVGALIDPNEAHRIVILARSNFSGNGLLMACRVEGSGVERRVALLASRPSRDQRFVNELVNLATGHNNPLIVVTGDYSQYTADVLRHMYALPCVRIYKPGLDCLGVAEQNQYFNQKAHCAHIAAIAAKSGRVSLRGVGRDLRDEMLRQFGCVTFKPTRGGRIAVENAGGKAWSLLSVVFGENVCL